MQKFCERKLIESIGWRLPTFSLSLKSGISLRRERQKVQNHPISLPLSFYNSITFYFYTLFIFFIYYHFSLSFKHKLWVLAALTSAIVTLKVGPPLHSFLTIFGLELEKALLTRYEAWK